jgi:hypothetical protein
MALIAQIVNPRLAQAIKEFEETADILFGTPTRKPFSLWGQLKKCFYKLFASPHNRF